MSKTAKTHPSRAQEGLPRAGAASLAKAGVGTGGAPDASPGHGKGLPGRGSPKTLYPAETTIWIPGVGRSKKNSKRLGIGWNGKPTIRNAEGFREWNRAAIAAIHAAAEPYLFSHAREVGVHITFNVSDRRKWDLTNWAESVMDALVEAGALADDDRFTVSQVSLKWLPCLPNQGREGISVTLSGLVSLPMTS